MPLRASFRFKPMFFALAAVLALAACGPRSSDPRAGGLYSYDPDGYEQRLDQRRERLSQLEAQQAAEESRRDELESEAAMKRAERDELAGRVDALDAEARRIQNAIYATEATTQQHKDELWQLNVKIKKVQQDIKLLRASAGNEGLAAREQELARLQKQLDELLREAEILTGL